MEARDRFSPTDQFERLGVGVHQISIIPRVQAAQSAYDSVRVQVNILYGMGTPTMGSCGRAILCPTGRIFHRTAKSVSTYGCKDNRDIRPDWVSRCAGLVDG